MKFVNLWLSEHLDFNLLGEISNKSSVNVLIHSAVLSKFPPSSSTVLSPVSFLNDTQQKILGNWIRHWDSVSRETIVKGITNFSKGSKKCKINENLLGAVERLFYHSKKGCAFASVFFSRISDLVSSETKVNIIAGENYRMTELMTLIWWVSLCDLKFKNNSVEFFFISRKANFKKTESLKDFFSWISNSSRIRPKIQGDLSPFNCVEDYKAKIAWVSTIRFSRGWDSEMHKKNLDVDNTIRITQFGQRDLYNSSFLEINSGNGASLKNLLRIKEMAVGFQSQIKWDFLFIDLNKGLESIGCAIEKFFVSGVAPIVLSQISQVVELLDEKLYFVKPEGFYSATTPLLEQLGVHEWVSRKRPKLLPVLLPHSFTSSHEFPASSYKSSLSFISSKELMPTVYDDPDSLRKERLVSLSKIQNDHLENSPKQNFDLGKYNRIVTDIVKCPKTQLVRLLSDRMINFGKGVLQKRHNLRVLKTKKFRFGMLLNYEHYEYCIGLDFTKYFHGIGKLGDELERVFGDDAALILRRKPGWTNLKLLKKVLKEKRTDTYSETIIVSPPSVSLVSFGKDCDLVLCFQGTSAIPELMMHGIPCIFLKSRDLPEKLEPEYVKIPETIVPQMNLISIRSNQLRYPNWISELGIKQKKWINSQMIQGEIFS